MDKLTQYRQNIQDLLADHARVQPIGGDIESQTVFDLQRDRYLLIDLGWDGQRRIYSAVIHIEIREGKIWIQRNQTDSPIADDLLARGVTREDIIVGLQPPEFRQYTGLGIA
ncbi:MULTISPECIES: XisI protein [Spirulina sp. CCY15215]|uniref:XisI protein n=1 Tax=Spirulina sp. CCY15215 TaxID=2767591 RepID=UPI001950EB46|nr:XisI protein [Spirulina major]